MSGVIPVPKQIAAPTVPELLEVSTLTADADLTELTNTHRENGWNGAVGEKPLAKEWNYQKQRLWQWIMRRTYAQGLVIERRAAYVTVGGTVDVGDTRRLTAGAATVDYVTAAGDATNTDIAQHWVAAINDDPVMKLVVWAQWIAGPIVNIWAVRPGFDLVWASAVTVDVGTVDATAALTEVAAAPLYMRAADEDNWDALGILVGSTSTEDLGGTGDDRMFFDPATASFRAGRVAAAQWNLASRGIASVAFGENCTASGAGSVAAGGSSTASGVCSIAIGVGTASADYAVSLGAGTASGLYSYAMGAGALASGAAAFAFGPTAQATADGAIAIGNTVTASAAGGIAVGVGAQATAVGAVALGGQSAALAPVASGTYSLAVGSEALASADAAVAIGTKVSASGVGAVAFGRGITGVGVMLASGRGAMVSGAMTAAGGTNVERSEATAENSRAHGMGCFATHIYSDARGSFASSTMRGERVRANSTFRSALNRFDEGHYSTLEFKGITTGATTPRLCKDFPTAADAETIYLLDDWSATLEGIVIARDDADHTAAWKFEAVVEQVNGAGGAITILVQTVTALVTDAGVAWVAPALAVSGTNGIDVIVTGVAATNIRWQGSVRITGLAQYVA